MLSFESVSFTENKSAKLNHQKLGDANFQGEPPKNLNDDFTESVIPLDPSQEILRSLASLNSTQSLSQEKIAQTISNSQANFQEQDMKSLPLMSLVLAILQGQQMESVWPEIQRRIETGQIAGIEILRVLLQNSSIKRVWELLVSLGESPIKKYLLSDLESENKAESNSIEAKSKLSAALNNTLVLLEKPSINEKELLDKLGEILDLISQTEEYRSLRKLRMRIDGLKNKLDQNGLKGFDPQALHQILRLLDTAKNIFRLKRNVHDEEALSQIINSISDEQINMDEFLEQFQGRINRLPMERIVREIKKNSGVIGFGRAVKGILSFSTQQVQSIDGIQTILSSIKDDVFRDIVKNDKRLHQEILLRRRSLRNHLNDLLGHLQSQQVKQEVEVFIKNSAAKKDDEYFLEVNELMPVILVDIEHQHAELCYVLDIVEKTADDPRINLPEPRRQEVKKKVAKLRQRAQRYIEVIRKEIPEIQFKISQFVFTLQQKKPKEKAWFEGMGEDVSNEPIDSIIAMTKVKQEMAMEATFEKLLDHQDKKAKDNHQIQLRKKKVPFSELFGQFS